MPVPPRPGTPVTMHDLRLAAAALHAQNDDEPEHHGRSDKAVIAAVLTAVVVIVLAALTTVAVAATFHAAPAAKVVVFTQEAPYQADNIAAPVQTATAVPAPMGGWTASRGIKIANRAIHWINTPYSFGAGNADGPTYGVPVDEDSRNDGHVIGFDCSGLVINAMAPWRSLTHLASTQYTEAGSFHPRLDSLQPGDLIFWSADGTINGIGHVAIYIGNGNVVQAPESGSWVQVTPINQVESGRIGVTRPLT